MIIDLNFNILAVEITECACDRQPPEHSPEDDVTALLLDPLLLIMSGCFVVQREIQSFPVSAQHRASVANVCTYQFISNNKYHDSGSPALVGNCRMCLLEFDISVFESSLNTIV
jgi:hypothetical protein